MAAPTAPNAATTSIHEPQSITAAARTKSWKGSDSRAPATNASTTAATAIQNTQRNAWP